MAPAACLLRPKLGLLRSGQLELVQLPETRLQLRLWLVVPHPQLPPPLPIFFSVVIIVIIVVVSVIVVATFSDFFSKRELRGVALGGRD